MTENIAATPGWSDSRLDEAFAALPQSSAVAAARGAYADCLAASKAPAAPSDNLGAEFAPCRATLRESLRAAGVEPADLARLEAALDAAEAEIAAGS